MDNKVKFSTAPTSTNWEQFLLSMPPKEPVHFYNIDNLARNGRQAIKRYYKKILADKFPPRRFSTATNKAQHSFTIIREE